jgi:hypothetical protein
MTARGSRNERRRWLAGAGIVLAVSVACQGTPVSPSQALVEQYGLATGDYTLTVYVPKGEAGQHVICVEENAVPDTVSIPVTVTLVGGIYHVTPVGDANLGLVVLMQFLPPTYIYGPALGQARDPATGVVVNISPLFDPNYPTQGDAMLSGTLAARNFAAGGVAGSVQFSLGGAARWCNPNRWILRPRS